ncbi:MAG TPA: transposase [Candidatus Dormibacteraeota bacterium]|nr:transposase [Candidatus Dormibacteraeota bacterium]
MRKIDAALDLSWLRSELAPHYSSTGRPSIDPELMIRMLVVGSVFAIRSERLICREVQVNWPYRWFCKLGTEMLSRIIRHFRAPATSDSAREKYSVACSSVLSGGGIAAGLVSGEGFAVDTSLIQADGQNDAIDPTRNQLGHAVRPPVWFAWYANRLYSGRAKLSLHEEFATQVARAVAPFLACDP